MKPQTGMNRGGRGGIGNMDPSVVRGVVMATYFADDTNTDTQQALTTREFSDNGKITAVRCDVLTYGKRFRTFMRDVPVAQKRHGLNDYTGLWIPKATSVDLSTGEPIREGGEEGIPPSDPRDMDGDHVLVEFLEGDIQQPFIRDVLPHPRTFFRQLAAAGPTRESRFRGVITKIDKDGNVFLDTTRSNSGALNLVPVNEKGAETPALDTSHGNVTLQMNHNAVLTVNGVNDSGASEKFQLILKDGELHVRLSNGESLKINGNAGSAITLLGDAVVKAAREDLLNTLWGSLKTTFDAHVHPEALLRSFLAVAGADPTLVALAPLAAAALASAAASLPDPPSTTAPIWNVAIGSNKLRFPAG